MTGADPSTAGLVRRSGVGRDAEGATIWWSVAEGRRGRRWREARVGADGLVHSLLLETDPDGRFSHLELATPAGLLTLHPEPDRTLHGNALSDAGLDHVVGLPWDRDGLVILAGSPVAAAAAVHLLARILPGAGVSLSYPALRIDAGLRLERGTIEVTRTATGSYVLAGIGPVTVDEEHLPLLADARSWPLEPAIDGPAAEP